MAAGKVNLDIGGKDQAAKLVTALNKRLDDTEKKLKTLATQSKVTEREGRKLWEQTRTPLEKYNVSLERAKKLLDQGKISQETYARAAKRSAEAMRQQYGQSAIASLKNYATGMLGVGAAISATSRAFEHMREVQRGRPSPLRGPLTREPDWPNWPAATRRNIGSC